MELATTNTDMHVQTLPSREDAWSLTRTPQDHFHSFLSAFDRQRILSRLIRWPSGYTLASMFSGLLTPEGQFFFLTNKLVGLFVYSV